MEIFLTVYSQDKLANLLRHVNIYWNKRPPQHNWVETCGNRPYREMDASVCSGRRSHHDVAIERWSASPDVVPCRFDIPWLEDDEPTLCGTWPNGTEIPLVNVVEVFKSAIGNIVKPIVVALGVGMFAFLAIFVNACRRCV